MLDIEGFRRAGYAAVDKICDYYTSLEKRDVTSQVAPGFLSKSIPCEAPEKPEEWALIEKDYEDIILPGITHWQHPSFFAYYPANVTFEGIIADMHAAAITNPGFNWACSPSVTELEIITVDWVGKMLGLCDAFWSTSPSGTGGGIILGSASEVTLTVAIAARERALRELYVSDSVDVHKEMEGGAGTDTANLDPDEAVAGGVNGQDNKQSAAVAGQDATLDAGSVQAQWRADMTGKLVIYGTTQTHSVGAKAALILGISFRALEVSASDKYALRGSMLRSALEEDTAQGRVPFLLIATLGTTSSGAVDHLAEIVDVAKGYPNLWLHVDAAYGGVSLAIPEMRAESYLDAINEGFHSFSTNLHKWGLVNFDCSPLLVRDRGELSSALTITPEFLRTKHADAGSVLDLRNMQISLGRRFRSLKIWMVLRSYGLEGFRAHLTRTMDLAKIFESLLRAEGGAWEIVAPPRFALVVFRLRPASASATSTSSTLSSSTPSESATASSSASELDALNRRFWEVLSSRSSEIALTQTILPSVGFCIRLVVGSPQTKDVHVRQAWDVVRECGEKVLSGV